MIILIAGSSHTGKTLMAQKLLEKYKFPYLSIDHLKMGLIRSGKTTLTPNDDNELTAYLWPVVREMIKTAVENRQNLIVEGCYIPFDWKKDFEEKYLEHMRYFCLIMTEKYIQKNFSKIKGYANIIEKRVNDSFWTKEMIIEENIKNFEMCQKYDCDYILIDDEYVIEI
ncbi:adenylate kinase [Fusobacterium varium]|uniref:adenylate kinase n=1 Tax=Fusobacterium varium TaxID=856 RepID=UPI00356AE7ED